MPFADVNDQRLYYEEHGSGEPLILIMGLGGDVLGWAFQIAPFAERHRVVAFDNRDVGRSSTASGPYEIADMAADTLALADALEIDAFHLLGVSMGGAIAQEIALAAPDRVRTLQLAVTWGGSGNYGRENARAWAKEIRSRPREDFIDAMLLLNLSEAFYENPSAVTYAKRLAYDNPYPQDPEAFIRQSDAAGNHETRDRLGRLAMPVHVISAEHDVLVPAWKQREIAELIEGSELTVLPSAPHSANLERPGDFNAAVLGFLARHAGTVSA
jgi:pimeloyl-ACP methyl ester carboxylesterase